MCITKLDIDESREEVRRQELYSRPRPLRLTVGVRNADGWVSMNCPARYNVTLDKCASHFQLHAFTRSDTLANTHLTHPPVRLDVWIPGSP